MGATEPTQSLNESPSEKEGKSTNVQAHFAPTVHPSMKVPPKRKGNNNPDGHQFQQAQPSMKVPPKRKGNHGARVGW